MTPPAAPRPFQDVNLKIQIEPYWHARVMLTKGKLTLTRKIQAPALDIHQAKRRMEEALDTIWTDWEVTWLTQPEEGR